MADSYVCPGCSAPLMLTSIGGERKYTCTGCGGCVVMVAALRHMAPDFAVQVWTEGPLGGQAAPGPAAPRCCFCGNVMEPHAVPTGSASVCRPCEAVWLDKAAAGSVIVDVPKAPAGPTLSSAALRCPECGAPFTNAWDTACRYCGAALHPPVQVVVVPS